MTLYLTSSLSLSLSLPEQSKFRPPYAFEEERVSVLERERERERERVSACISACASITEKRARNELFICKRVPLHQKQPPPLLQSLPPSSLPDLLRTLATPLPLSLFLSRIPLPPSLYAAREKERERGRVSSVIHGILTSTNVSPPLVQPSDL